MNKKLISIVMAFVIGCCPINILKAEENIHKEATQQTEQVEQITDKSFYIEPDVKRILLKLNSTSATINEEKYTLNSVPTIINGKLYVPYKFVVDELFNGNGSYDAKSKAATLTQYKKTIVLYEGKNTVLVNGSAINIDAPPIIQKGSLLVPLKFICETFEISFSFDSNTSNIKLEVIDDLSQPRKGNRPVAKFSFKDVAYIAGQKIEILDESLDVDGDTIIARQWQLNDDHYNRTDTLDSLLEKPIEGLHHISLRVKDNKGNWSLWYTQKVTIQPNKAPIISDMQVSKDSFSQGEKIDIVYKYENEEWEEIAEELWSYRYIGITDLKKDNIQGKPVALFYPGKFLIALQLKDAYGNLSETKETTLTITDKVLQSELDYKFKEGFIGSVIDNFHNFNYEDYELVNEYTVTNTGAKLLMSNSPESVTQKGILYKDVIEGQGRILYHHRNMMEDITGRKRLVIVMENKNDHPITVTKRREGTKGPTHDILFAGAQVLLDFLNREFFDSYTLEPGEKRYLFDTVRSKWNKGDTVSGMIEIYSTEEVDITIALTGQDTQICDIEMLPILKRDGVHTRGSFENADRYYNLTIDNDKPYKIMLGKPAGGMEDWIEGYDALTGDKVMNKGNYGMIYQLRLHVKEDTGILFNVRSNIFKGAIGFTHQKSYEMPYRAFIKNVQQGYVAGVAKEGKVSELLYVLPNGSAAPVLFCFIPKSQWNK